VCLCLRGASYLCVHKRVYINLPPLKIGSTKTTNGASFGILVPILR
jgi:hypothetical protein